MVSFITVRRSSRSLSSSHFIGDSVRVLKTRGSTDLSDVHDLLYLANLTVGGAQYTVHVRSSVFVLCVSAYQA